MGNTFIKVTHQDLIPPGRWGVFLTSVEQAGDLMNVCLKLYIRKTEEPAIEMDVKVPLERDLSATLDDLYALALEKLSQSIPDLQEDDELPSA